MPKKNELQQQLKDVQNQLRALRRQLEEIKEVLTLESQTRASEDDWHESREYKLSTSLFYAGLLLGSLCGIIGNIFVQLLFLEMTFNTIIKLIISGLGFFMLCVVLWREMQKHARPPKDVRIAFKNDKEREGV